MRYCALALVAFLATIHAVFAAMALINSTQHDHP